MKPSLLLPLAAAAAALPQVPMQVEGNGAENSMGAGPPTTNRTVFEMIRQNDQTTYFARLLESHGQLRDMLDDHEETRVFTVLVPTDAAFRGLEGFERSKGQLLGAMLEYHVLEGRHSAEDLGGTLPTVFAEGELGGRRQRVRITAGRAAGVEVNFYGRVLGSESYGRNGAVYLIDSVLVPPPRCAALVGSLPGRLGTFARALRETGVAEEIRGRRGVTLLAPSDEAWEEELGAEARRFLLSRVGRAYLRALVRYHVAEEVLYTDDGEERRRRRVGTLLGGEDVSVEFGERGGSRTARVNGAVVEVGDVPARDGVVHVVDRVLLPPARGAVGDGDGGRISVQGLKRRLGRYVESGDGVESEEL